jgi:hypothetical protein
MGMRAGAGGWKVLIGLAVVCGVLVFTGGFLHRRALEDSVAREQTLSSTYVKAKLTRAVADVDLSTPVKDTTAASLSKEIALPSGDDLRIFAPNGTAVFTSPGTEAFQADDEAIDTAKTGNVSHVIDGPDLRVYAPILGKGDRVVAVAAVVSNYSQLWHDVSGPLDALRLPLVALGVVFLVAGVLLMLQATKGQVMTGSHRAPAAAREQTKPAPEQAKPAPKSRISGFEAVAVQPEPTAPDSAAPVGASEEQAASEEASATSRFGLRRGGKSKAPEGETSASPTEKRSLFGRRSSNEGSTEAVAVEPTASGPAPDREVVIRQALEDQLEQLRTQIKTQADEKTNTTRDLTARLEDATRRAEEAEARTQGAAVPDATPDRTQELERELGLARTAAADAIARADELQRAVDSGTPAAPPDPAAEDLITEMTAKLADAQQRATSAEQRAASVESVRDELEVRVAQLGTKAGELERRANELEASLQEANAGGDAVRAEIAALTAALTAANARVQELESGAAADAPSETDHEADRTEIARLRSQLANQMERAQVAEDRIATLEVDVLAAARGVRELPVETPAPVETPRAPAEEPRSVPSTPEATAQVPPAPADADRYDDMWTAAFSPPPLAEAQPVRSEPAPARPTPEPARPTPGTVVERPEAEAEPARPEREAAAAPGGSAADEPGEPTDELSPDDMWSLRARLAEAAARKKRHHE